MEAMGALDKQPVELADAIESLPSASGLYAWWARPGTLPAFQGHLNSDDPSWQLVYLGLATRLRQRILSNHLKRSGSSTLRRVLAGLLLDDQGYRTRWTDRVILVDEDESRLTQWMHEHLRLTWVVVPDPKVLEAGVICAWRPMLNVDHARPGEALDLVKAARKAYRDSAGQRPVP